MLIFNRFLLAELHLNSLQGKDTLQAIRKALSRIIPEAQANIAYTKIYDKAMDRIQSQPPYQVRRAKQILGWIISVKRQLQSAELQYGLAIEPHTSKLDVDNLDPLESLVSVCAGLVMVDKQSGIIRFVHSTTQSYFDSSKEQWFPDIERNNYFNRNIEPHIVSPSITMRRATLDPAFCRPIKSVP